MPSSEPQRVEDVDVAVALGVVDRRGDLEPPAATNSRSSGQSAVASSSGSPRRGELEAQLEGDRAVAPAARRARRAGSRGRGPWPRRRRDRCSPGLGDPAQRTGVALAVGVDEPERVRRVVDAGREARQRLDPDRAPGSRSAPRGARRERRRASRSRAARSPGRAGAASSSSRNSSGVRVANAGVVVARMSVSLAVAAAQLDREAAGLALGVVGLGVAAGVGEADQRRDRLARRGERRVESAAASGVGGEGALAPGALRVQRAGPVAGAAVDAVGRLDQAARRGPSPPSRAPYLPRIGSLALRSDGPRDRRDGWRW